MNASIASTDVLISLPPSIFSSLPIQDREAGLFFVFYDTAVLFPFRAPGPDANSTDFILSPVISASVAGMTINNLIDPVTILLQISDEVCFTVLLDC